MECTLSDTRIPCLLQNGATLLLTSPGEALQFASDTHRADKELVLAAVEWLGDSWIAMIDAVDFSWDYLRQKEIITVKLISKKSFGCIYAAYFSERATELNLEVYSNDQ